MRLFWTLAGIALARIALATEPAADVGRWAARMSDAPNAMEYWDLSARLDSGHFLFARFLITNEGPGSHTAAGLGTLVHPDGRIVPFRYGKRDGDWTLSDDGRMIDIASLTLDLRGQPRRFEMDSDKRAIKIHFQFETPGPILAPPGRPRDHHSEVLEVAAPTTGSLWVGGMTETVTTKGMVSLTHAWMDPAESDLVLRQVEILVQHREMSVYATEFLAPDGSERRWMAVRRSGKALEVIGSPVAEFEAAANPARRGYPAPRSAAFRSERLSVTAAAKRELLVLDPTEVIPQPFRFLLSLKMKPVRITADAECEVGFGATSADRLSKAPCLLVATYLNPLNGNLRQP